MAFRVSQVSAAYSSNEGDFGQPQVYHYAPSEVYQQSFSRQNTIVALSKKEIDYIAHLARLQISAEEIPLYADKLGRIVDFINELSAAETKDLVPMAHPLEMSQRLRPDEVRASNERDRFQENAAATAQGLYLVPRVIE